MTVAIVTPFEGLYGAVTRRIRAAGTIFQDRIKLILRQSDIAQWSKLDKPYLLVVPTQTRTPTNLETDVMRFVNPRAVTLVGQFDGQGSEAEYMAASQIEIAEKQLIYLLANWTPNQNCTFSFYRPTLYGGMRFQETREPDVKAHFYFVFEETFVLEDVPEIDESDFVAFDGIQVNMHDPCCNIPCEPPAVAGPKISVTGGGCPQPSPPDPCAAEECPPIIGGVYD